jgi:hypothetical protein
MKATRVQTVASDAKCNYASALSRRHPQRFGHTVVGTFLGTYDAVFARLVQKPEGKRDKATVFLSVAFLEEEQWSMQPSLSHFGRSFRTFEQHEIAERLLSAEHERRAVARPGNPPRPHLAW